ncbi:hypothetical protein FACS189485_23140 [Spirochaetia bacterium]|nr:hypothetical protein FACS189485_23140 [Spirochaetia bacterium]
MAKIFYGCWPTMITPFTDDNKIDFKAVKRLIEWYIERGSDGIFAVCQSSEMFFLSEQEKVDLARAVKDAAGGRIKVIASGHTADDKSKQIEELGRMAGTGVDAVILVSNRLARQDEGEDKFRRNFEEIVRQLPGVPLGMYECPYPYLRLISTDFLKEAAQRNNWFPLRMSVVPIKYLRSGLPRSGDLIFHSLTPIPQPFCNSLSTAAMGTTGLWLIFI